MAVGRCPRALVPRSGEARMACALHVRATVHSFVIANKVHVAAVPGPSPNWAHPASANRANSAANHRYFI